MRLRFAFVPALAAAATVAVAAPAFAHEEITPKTIPVGQAAFLSLTAANESSSDLVKIVLKAPAGLALGEATRSPAGWSAAASGATVTWTGGALKPGTFETFGFEVEGPDQPGILTFTVTSTGANGRADEHEVEVTATAPGTGGSATPGTAPAATTATTAAAAAPTTVTTAAAAGADGEGDDDSDGASGTAKAALALSIVALLLAGGSLALATRRRPAGGGPAPGAAQDW